MWKNTDNELNASSVSTQIMQQNAENTVFSCKQLVVSSSV